MCWKCLAVGGLGTVTYSHPRPVRSLPALDTMLHIFPFLIPVRSSLLMYSSRCTFCKFCFTVYYVSSDFFSLLSKLSRPNTFVHYTHYIRTLCTIYIKPREKNQFLLEMKKQHKIRFTRNITFCHFICRSTINFKVTVNKIWSKFSKFRFFSCLVRERIEV